MSTDLFYSLREGINRGSKISSQLRKHLTKIQIQEKLDLSEIIQDIENAGASFNRALTKLEMYK